MKAVTYNDEDEIFQEEIMKKTKLFNLLALLGVGVSLVSCSQENKTSEAPKASDKTSVKEDATSEKKDSATSEKTDTTVSDKNVSKLAIKTNPTKMTYIIGETFDPTGGVLTVTYKNKSTADLPMTDNRVTITNLNTATDGKKSVKITFGGVSVSLKNIDVTKEQYDITFETNGGSSLSSVKVEKGEKLARPANPTKEGFVFDDWYTDTAMTLVYDFDKKIDGPMTLYARWLAQGKATVNVTFEYGYYGAVPEKRTQKIESGSSVTKISVDPKRKGYTFSGWQKDGENFDFSSKLSADTTLKAKWVRSTSEYTGTQTYKFEAEDIDFTGITGAGLSGTTTGAGSIVTMAGFNASQDMYVSYMYKENNTLRFEIISDVDVSNVTFKASMSQEVENYTYNKDNYAISVNSTALDYGNISFNNVPPRKGDLLEPQAFQEYTLGTISLKKGNNEISFTTANHDAITGTTMNAHAPLLDYISLTADNAVLEWDNVKGYPVEGNYKK